MSLTLRVQLPEANTVKTLRFAETMSVYDACIQVVEKTREGGKDHAMFKPFYEGAETGEWLRMDRTLENHDLRSNDLVQFKKRHQVVTAKLIDGSLKKILVNLTQPTMDVHKAIGEKLKLRNWEEFCLYVLETGAWLNVKDPITQQVGFSQVLGYKKRYYVSDTAVDREDPVELHLSYAQAMHEIISGTQDIEKEEAVNFSGMQAQVEFGNFNPAAHKPGFLKIENFLPSNLIDPKKGGFKKTLTNKVAGTALDAEKDMMASWKRFTGMDENTAKLKYVQLARSLPTYGLTLYHCIKKSGPPSKDGKPKQVIAGFCKRGYVEFDSAARRLVKEIKIEQVKRWMVDDDVLTLDFGEANENDEYCVLSLPQAEDFSETIGGYVDILLRLRKDAGTVEEEQDASFAAEEQVALVRGSATSSQTSAQVAKHSSFVAKAQTIGTAQQAVELVLNQAFSSMNAQQTQKTNLTGEQLKGQISSNAAQLGTLAQRFHDLITGPNQENNKLADLARQIAMFVDNMVVNSKQAQGLGIGDFGSSNLVGAAKSVTETFAQFLDLAGDPQRVGFNAMIFNSKQSCEAALAALLASSSGVFADLATQNLLLELSKSAASAMDALIGQARSVPIADRAKKDEVDRAADTISNGAQTLLSVVGRVAMTASDPNCQRYVQEAAKTVNSTLNFLLAAAQQSGGAFDMNDLNERARSVAEALKHLLTAAEIPTPTGDKKALEYFEAAQAVMDEATGLMGAAGKPQVINNRMGNVRKNLPILINHTKEKALKSDDLTKERLHTYAKAVAATSKDLAGICPMAIKEPTNNLWGHKLHDASARVAEAVAALMGDAGKQMSEYALASAAKNAAAATAALVAGAGMSVSTVGDREAQGALRSGIPAASTAVSDLLQALKQARPDNDAVVVSAERFCPAAYQLVTTAKNAIPAITDPEQKKAMIVKTSTAAKAIQQLLQAAKNKKIQASEDVLKDAMERLRAMETGLDAALMAAEAGFVDKVDIRHDQAVRMLQASGAQVENATKQAVAVARNQPEQLALAIGQVGDAMQSLIDNALAVAGSTEKASEQRSIVNAAKGVNVDVNQLVISAKAMAQSPSDALDGMLNDTTRNVFASLARLFGSTATVDTTADYTVKVEESPLHKEAEESMSIALDSIKSTLANLQQHANQAPQLAANAGLSPAAANIAVAILTSSAAITRAQGTLVQAAKAGHYEIRQMEMRNNVPSNDTFARGLTNAAPVMADAVRTLAEAAIGTTGGSTTEAIIRTAADGIGRAAESLVLAFSANPDRQSRLAASAKQVTNAISRLISASAEVSRLEREAEEGKKGYDISAEQLAEIQSQMEILELEKKIRRARMQMNAM